MISVIIPARNAASSLPALFLSLYEAAMDGLVSEVIIADCGSTDKTPQIADAAGATIVAASFGQQLLAGAAAARKPWLLFIHANSVLEPGWEREARVFMAKGGTGAAAFRVRSAGKGIWARLQALRRPGGCPALLFPAKLLESGGALPPPVDEAGLMRRLGSGSVKLNAVVIAGTGRKT